MRCRLTKFFFSEEIVVVFLIVVAMGISLNLFRNEISQGKNLDPIRFQTFEHNYLPDFNAYLSKMTQGGKGYGGVYERLTNEPHDPSLLQIFYLVIGKIGIGLLGLRADFAYHFWRFVLGGLWFLVSYLFILTILPGKERRVVRILSFALFIFAGAPPFKVVNPAEFGIPIFGQKFRVFLEGWSYLDPLQRVAFVPHWSAGHIGTVLSILFLIKSNVFSFVKEKIKIRWLIAASVVGLLSGLTLPSSVMVVCGIWALYIIVLLFLRYFRRVWVTFPLFILFGIISGMSLLYIKWVTQFYPWKALAIADATPYLYNFPWQQYMWGLGVTGYLGMMGAVFVFLKLVFKRTSEKSYILIGALWILSSFLFLLLFDKVLHYDQRRFIQVGTELPLAIFTVVLLDTVVGFLLRKIRAIKNIVLLVICILLLIPSAATWYISYNSRVTFIRDRVAAAYPLVPYWLYVVYPPRDWMEGIFWLWKNTDANTDVVYCDYVCGNFVAAYAGNRVYVGHGAQSVDYNNKLTLVKEFFSGGMTQDNAKLYLMKNYVKYVFAGPQETDYGGGFLRYKFLKPVYKQQFTTIYKIE